MDAIILWRLVSGRHREKFALKLVGFSIFALAAYVGFNSIKSLVLKESPAKCYIGIAIAALSRVRDAAARAGKEKCRRAIKQPRDDGGFKTNRHLHLFIGYTSRRFAS